jgi:enoyl-CoA hydratase/carnithine racemase
MTVHVERDTSVWTITIDNPTQRNALDRETFVGLGAAFEAAAQADEVRAIVLTAVGDKAFCSGMDLASFSGAPSVTDAPEKGPGIFTEQFFPKPIVAAVNGAAVGGGLGIALGCDLIVAVDDATFGMPEVRRGLIGAGVVSRAALRLTPALAMELALTGAPVSATRAYEMGLINRVVTRAELMPAALGLAQLIAANGPIAVRATKALVYDTQALGRVEMRTVRQKVAHVFASDDAKEGVQAWKERRPPSFTGH